jgi:hypothetical protein
MDFLEKAKDWGEKNYPNKSNHRLAAFANSVQYLCTGFSGGYGGPSIREHAVSWALAGDGSNHQVESNLGKITIQFPDGRLPAAGEWGFKEACEFAAPICFGNLPAVAGRIYREESCFDDDPQDIRLLESDER